MAFDSVDAGGALAAAEVSGPSGTEVALAESTVASPTAVGTEFLLNAPTSDVAEIVGSDRYGSPRSIASDAGGNSVAVWQSAETVMARAYNASTDMWGTEFRVNPLSIPADTLRGPVVAMSETGGNYVVAWTSGNSAYVQRYDASGNAAGGPVLVDGNGKENVPSSVVIDPNGNFTVLYHKTLVKGGVETPYLYFRRYDANGQPLTSKATKVVDLQLLNGRSSMDADGQGNFIVVWDDTYSPRKGPSGSLIYAQRYNTAGSLVGSRIQVAEPSGLRWQSNVAMDDSGNFAVTWVDRGVSNGSVTSLFRGRIFDAQASLLYEFDYGTHLEVPTAMAWLPSSTSGSRGDLLLVWADRRTNEMNELSGVVAAQRFSGTTGQPIDISPLEVSTKVGSQLPMPSVAANAAGDFTVVWAGPGTEVDPAGVYARRYELSTTSTSSLSSDAVDLALASYGDSGPSISTARGPKATTTDLAAIDLVMTAR